MSSRSTRRLRSAVVAVLVAAFVLLLIGRQLSTVDWDPAVYLLVPSDEGPLADYYASTLGDVPTFSALGHDGKYFFIQATDPLLLNPEADLDLLDRPLYRSQRMLYPMLASAGGLAGPQALAWSMLLVNLVALVAGTYVTARLATSLGGSSWLGLAFGFNLGLILELMIDGSGIVAWALAVSGLWAVVERRLPIAAFLFALAALSREAMLIVPIGVFAYMWRYESRRVWSIVAWPAGVVLAWAVYVRFRFERDLLASESEELGVPFEGIWEAASDWLATVDHRLFVGFLILALAAVMIVRAYRKPSVISYGVLGFAVLAPFLTRQVWLNAFDATRALAPLLTAFILVIFLPDAQERTHPVEVSRQRE